MYILIYIEIVPFVRNGADGLMFYFLAIMSWFLFYTFVSFVQSMSIYWIHPH